MNDDMRASQEPVQELVAFRVAGQDFCIEIMSVREIRGWTQTTVLPHAPVHVNGVINLRGSVVPVMDLSECLGFGQSSPGPRHVIIIAVISNQTVGLLAEEVSDILTFHDMKRQAVPNVGAEQVRACICEVITAQDRMLRKIDLTRMLPRLGRDAA